MLGALGLDELVAAGRAELARTAVALARDELRSAALRARVVARAPELFHRTGSVVARRGAAIRRKIRRFGDLLVTPTLVRQ